MWQRAFVATSMALGEPLEAATSALSPVDGALIKDFVAALQVESRRARAQAMARELAVVAAAVEEAELR